MSMKRIKDAIRDDRLYDYISETMPESDEKELLLNLIYEADNLEKVIEDIEDRQEIDHYEVTDEKGVRFAFWGKESERDAKRFYDSVLARKKGAKVFLHVCYDFEGKDRKELDSDWQDEEEE